MNLSKSPLDALVLATALSLYSLQASASCAALDPSPSPSAVVDAQLAAYNAHDVDDFARCYADTAEMTDLSGKRPSIEGRSGLLTTFAFLKRMPKEFHVEIVKRIVSGPVVIDQERFVGLPSGKSRPDAVAVYEIRGGRIVKVWFPPAE